MQIFEAHLTPNAYSRPGRHPEMRVLLLPVHWTGYPTQRAWGTRAYLEDLKNCRLGPDGKPKYGSTQGICDQDGSILQLMGWDPVDIEMAYQCGDNWPNYSPEALEIMGDIYPNAHCLGLEWCCDDASGRPTDATWGACAEWYADRCIVYRLPVERIVTHNWITGKGTWGIEAKEGPCHRWFVEHPAELERFRDDVRARIADTM